MQSEHGIRGDYFTDRLGGWTEGIMALVGAGIAASRFKSGANLSDEVLVALFLLEFVGAIAITRSKVGPMRFALALFLFRVAAGVAYMGVVHHDILAKSTLGFPVVVAIYCWVRVRALTKRP